MAKRYVWLNINDGSFSNSWSEPEHDKNKDQEWYKKPAPNWKLIEFECLNDPAFMFYNKMKIVTNTKQ